MSDVEFCRHAHATFLQLPILRQVPHAFGTKRGYLASLPALGVDPSQLVTLMQVHGNEVLTITNVATVPPEPRVYDAVITNQTGLALGIRTADCVPLLMADTTNGVIAAVHAGWRGLLSGVISRTLTIMCTTFGSSPRNILVAIGPGIGPCCYEVRDNIFDQFLQKHKSSNAFAQQRHGRCYLDLPSFSRLQLRDMGIPGANIETAALCTGCRNDLFYSYRRDGNTGRQLNWIMME
jgi:hypothetical protein